MRPSSQHLHRTERQPRERPFDRDVVGMQNEEDSYLAGDFVKISHWRSVWHRSNHT